MLGAWATEARCARRGEPTDPDARRSESADAHKDRLRVRGPEPPQAPPRAGVVVRRREVMRLSRGGDAVRGSLDVELVVGNRGGRGRWGVGRGGGHLDGGVKGRYAQGRKEGRASQGLMSSFDLSRCAERSRTFMQGELIRGAARPRKHATPGPGGAIAGRANFEPLAWLRPLARKART